jgi:hypothetical protein
LYVDAPRFTKVLGRPIGGGEWTQVCSAPCDALVPLDWQYQMRARGMKQSATFQLDAIDGESVVVHLHPAYTAWFVSGLVAIGIGVTVAVVGLPVVLISSIGCGPIPGGPTSPDFNPAPCHGQVNSELGIVAAVSASLIALGALATLTNRTTTVSQGAANEAPAPAPPPASLEPVWHTAERRDVPALPTSLAAPLVTLHF